MKGAGKTGKGGKGKGNKGGKGKWNGKGGYNYKYNNYYPRSFGKAVGKGLNNFENEYWNVWGQDNGDGSNWWSEEWMPGSGMSLMMMLEGGGESIEQKNTKVKVVEDKRQTEKQKAKTAGEFDPLKNAERRELIKLQNKFEALYEKDGDIDDEDELNALVTENDGDSNDDHKAAAGKLIKHKPNKRQRQRRREAHVLDIEDDQCAASLTARLGAMRGSGASDSIARTIGSGASGPEMLDGKGLPKVGSIC